MNHLRFRSFWPPGQSASGWKSALHSLGQEGPGSPSHRGDGLVAAKAPNISQPDQGLDACGTSDCQDQAMNVLIGHFPLEWRKRLGDPADRPSLPERKVTPFTVRGLKRKPQHGALLGLRFDNHPGELRNNCVKPFRDPIRRRRGQQRRPRGFRMGRGQQLPLPGEVPVGRAPRYPCGLRRIIHGRRNPGRHQGAGRRNQCVQRAALLARPAGVGVSC